MRTKAGIACLAFAIFALAAFAATGLGAKLTTNKTLSRPGAITLRAQVMSPAAKRGKKTPSVSYLSTKKPQPLPTGATQTVGLTGCPKGTHITNISVAALHGQQAQYLTIHGQGLLVSKSGKVTGMFVDVSNDSDTLNAPGFSVNVIGSIVCVK